MKKAFKSVDAYQDQQLRLLAHKNNFQKKVIKVRVANNINKKGFSKFSEHKKWLQKNNPDQIRKNTFSILRSFDLTQNYYMPIYSYVLFNDFNHGLHIGKGIEKAFYNANPRVFDKVDKRNGKMRIFLEIYADTTLQDVQRIWETKIECDKYRMHGYKRTRDRKKPSENFDRDEKIYLLAQSRISYREIAKIVKKELKKTLIYDDIAKIVKRFKQKIQDM